MTGTAGKDWNDCGTTGTTGRTVEGLEQPWNDLNDWNCDVGAWGLVTQSTSDVNLALRTVDGGLDQGEKALIARELKRGYENKYRKQMSPTRDMERHGTMELPWNDMEPWNYHGTTVELPWNDLLQEVSEVHRELGGSTGGHMAASRVSAGPAWAPAQ